jgi:hypothetical protein
MTSVAIALFAAAAGAGASADVRQDPKWTRQRITRQLTGVVLLSAVAGAVIWWFAATVAVLELPSRPALVVTRGAYFRVSIPKGWQFTENANAFEAAAPDGATGSTASLVLGMFGNRVTPRAYLEMVLQSLGHTDARIVTWQDLAPEPAFMNFQWQRGYAEMTFTYRGTPVRAGALVGVIQGAGQYGGVIMAAQAPAGKWARERAYLMRVAQSAVITNPRQVAGVDRMALPKNIPHDYIYGDYNAAFTARGVPAAKISQAQQEGTMGYELMQSPTTDTQYEMPLEAYDAKIGGYRNPDRPTERLARPPWLR